MLFPYTYVNHDMEKMQAYIDYIFFEVWCKAVSQEYDISLFDGKPELKKIIEAYFYSEKKGWGNFFISKIQEIYEIFKDLTPEQIQKLKSWYRANNDIETLCANHSQVIPVRYEELESYNYNLSLALKAFFKELYSDKILALKAISSKIGKINEHYKKFMDINNTGICPFCGLADIEAADSSIREAYDHYIPKSIYPFNSINFKNLAPMCHKCNSSYKTTKDPLYEKDSSKRRKAFYSYMTGHPDLKIELQFENKDIEQLTNDDIELVISSKNHPEEVDTWMDVFDIEKRYKSKCTHETNGSKYWLTQIIEESQNVGITPEKMLSVKMMTAEKYPYTEVNFLRKPFLETCEKLGLFTEFETGKSKKS
jgi:hypothetical protein